MAGLVRQLETERHQSHNLTDNRGGFGLALLGGGGGASPSSSGGGGGRGQITIQFLEKRRRKTWYAMRGDDEVPWESWTIKVTVADPRTEGGTLQIILSLKPPSDPLRSVDPHAFQPKN